MDPLNLILLIMVVLIGWRLRSVLGTRNDDEEPSSRADAYRLNSDAYENPPAPRQDNAREVIKAADATENSEAEKATSTDAGAATGTDMAAADAPEQGEIATFCYVITKGTADVLLNKGKDNEALIATLGEGDLFGEIGLLDDKTKTRTATVTASKKLKCLEIDAKTFADLIDEKTGDYRSETTSANIKQLVALRLSQLSEA